MFHLYPPCLMSLIPYTPQRFLVRFGRPEESVTVETYPFEEVLNIWRAEMVPNRCSVSIVKRKFLSLRKYVALLTGCRAIDHLKMRQSTSQTTSSTELRLLACFWTLDGNYLFIISPKAFIKSRWRRIVVFTVCSTVCTTSYAFDCVPLRTHYPPLLHSDPEYLCFHSWRSRALGASVTNGQIKSSLCWPFRFSVHF